MCLTPLYMRGRRQSTPASLHGLSALQRKFLLNIAPDRSTESGIYDFGIMKDESLLRFLGYSDSLNSICNKCMDKCFHVTRGPIQLRNTCKLMSELRSKKTCEIHVLKFYARLLLSCLHCDPSQ